MADNVIPASALFSRRGLAKLREKTANEEFEDGLKELCDKFCERVAEENEGLHGCACGSGCCGDREHCGPCWVEPPLTMCDFLERGEQINRLNKQLVEVRMRLATAEREREAQREWVGIQASLIEKLKSDLATSVTVHVRGGREVTTLEAT